MNLKFERNQNVKLPTSKGEQAEEDKNDQGDWVYGEERIGNIMVPYFQELLNSSHPSSIDEACSFIKNTLSLDEVALVAELDKII